MEFSYFHHLSSSCPLMNLCSWICNLLGLIFFRERLLASLSSREGRCLAIHIGEESGEVHVFPIQTFRHSLLFTLTPTSSGLLAGSLCESLAIPHHFEYIDFVFKYLVRWVPPHSSEFSWLVSDTYLYELKNSWKRI